MAHPTTPISTAVGRRATRAFEGAGYRTLEDLAGTSEKALLALHSVGPRAIRILRERGVRFTP